MEKLLQRIIKTYKVTMPLFVLILTTFPILASAPKNIAIESQEFTLTQAKKTSVKKVTLNGSRKTLSIGTSYKLRAKITPANATKKAVKWKSSNKNIATVNRHGKVTAKRVGKATITATARDGSKKKALFVITVKAKENYKSAYAPIIKAFAATQRSGFRTYSRPIEDSYIAIAIRDGWINDGSYAAGYMSSVVEENNLRYVIKDISGDGIPELLVGSRNKTGPQKGDIYILSVYTCLNNKPISVFQATPTYSATLLKNNVLYTVGAHTGAIWEIFYKFTADGITLKKDEFVEETPFPTSKTTYSHCGDRGYSGAKKISKKKYTKLTKKYRSKELKLKGTAVGSWK